MASIATSPNGHRRILFYDSNKDRKAIHLGKCSDRNAQKVKTRVESILVAKLLGITIDQDDAVWLAGEGKEIRPKLEKVGLVERLVPEPPKAETTLAEFLGSYLERHCPSKKPATRIVWAQVVTSLNKHMPKGIALNAVTAGHAKGYLEKLLAQRKSNKDGTIRKLSSTTIHKRISFARQFFQDAVDWELIGKNPFAKIKTQGTSLKSNVEVPREQVEMILAKCSPVWKGIVALSRFGGLRCPSEVLSITWGDIDWELGRMSVPEPKVEHHEGRGIRSCPLFPELRAILEELFEEATVDGKYPSAESFVINKQAYRDAAMRSGGWANANLRTQLLKIMRKAGVAPWRRLFHSMRASRQTELEREFPLHVVCSWLGNTEAVAKKSYLLVTDADFAKAIQPVHKSVPEQVVEPEHRGTKTTRADAKTTRRETKTTPHGARTVSHENEKTLGIVQKSFVFREIPRVSKWRRGELNPRPAILPTWHLHV